MRGHAGLPGDRSRRRATALPAARRRCVRRFSSRFASLPPVFSALAPTQAHCSPGFCGPPDDLRRGGSARLSTLAGCPVHWSSPRTIAAAARPSPATTILARGWRIRGALESGSNSNVTHHLEVSIMPPMRCPRRPARAARPSAPHRLREDHLPHSWTGLLPPPRHQGSGGRRHYRRGQARCRTGGASAPEANSTSTSGAMSSNRTNGFTKNAPCHQASRQPRGRRCDAALARSAVLPAEGAAMVRSIAAELVCAASGATLSESGGIPEMALATGAPKCWVFGNISE